MSTPRTASPSAAAPDTAQSQVDAPSTESSSAPDRTLSAHKRRGSSIDIAAEKTSQRPESDATLGELSPQASKRARPDERPPKVLPRRYELCAVVDVVELISYMLSELIATNDAIRTSNGGLTRFHSRSVESRPCQAWRHVLIPSQDGAGHLGPGLPPPFGKACHSDAASAASNCILH